MITIQAEDFATLDGYSVQTIDGLTVIRINFDVPSGETATASTSFAGETGLYTIQVQYLDENDGEGTIGLSIGGTAIDSITLNSTAGSTTGFPVSTWNVNGGDSVLINAGSVIEFTGVRDAEEYARIDAIILTPVVIPEEPAEPIDPDSAITIQAEDFDSLEGYSVGFAGDVTVIRINPDVPSGSSATASTTFTEETGLYTIQVKYLDENDGEGAISFSLNGTEIDSIELNSDAGDALGLPVSTWDVNGGDSLLIKTGDVIEFTGIRNLEEYTRIDEIILTPVVVPEDPEDPEDPEEPIDPNPEDPENPVEPNPEEPQIPGQPSLKITAENLLGVEGAVEPQPVQFSVIQPAKQGAIEVGFFVVEDEQGTINGLTPEDEDYFSAALSTTKSLFSTLGDLDINQLDFSRLLSLEPGKLLSFFVIKNGTVDSVIDGGLGELILGSPLFDEAASDILNVEFQEAEGSYLFNWELNGDGQFDDFSIKVEKADGQQAPLGANLQGGQQSEVLDLRSLAGQVTLQLKVLREAASTNQLGFYQVENEQGTIVDEFGNALNPGDSGYVKALYSSG
ncbi:MAG: hypothetical protein HC929_09205 [Leptolyngbyaceae cyanobacterium SM2_5_2]|nr:hypothetical protein [Leptolyngbyaceae cyanobacterium SM2_5_2]